MEIREIKERLTILEVLQHYGLKADKHNRLLCPFHADKTPSLQIYPKTNTFCCFSSNCSAGTGDVIQFIQLKENCSKREAIVKAKSLLNAEGLTLSVMVAVPAAKVLVAASSQDSIAVVPSAFKRFSKALPLTKRAVEYLQGRRIDYKLHEVGYISDRYHHELSRDVIEGYVQVGLLKALPVKGYSVWGRDCVIFPLKDRDNKIVSLYGRSISNDGDSRHFYLTGRNGLYPGYPSLQTKRLLLTESIIDAVSLLEQEGIKNSYTVLSLYGTNGLTEEHIQAISQLPELEEIVFMLDGDAAGCAATDKHAHTLRALLPQVRITHIVLPDGEDVNSLLVGHDAKLLIDLVEQRVDFSFSREDKKEMAAPALHAGKLDTRDPELLLYESSLLHIEIWGGIRVTSLDRMKVTLKLQYKGRQLLPIRDTLDLYSRSQTEQLVQTISERFDANIKQTEVAISELTNELESYRIRRIEALQPKQAISNVLTEAVRQTAISELKRPKLLERTGQLLQQCGIVGEATNSLIAYLVYSTRKQAVPLHVMFLGSSGSGKTYLQEKISELIPEEDKMEITQITENALYYFKQEELKNKLLLIEDLDGALTVFYPLRELQTKRRISKTVTLKDSKGNLKTITLVVEGPVCVSGCTTKEKIYEDNANRCLLLYTDQSRDQDKRINEYQTKLAAGEVNKEREQQYKELFKNMQRVLRPIQVINPYAQYIALPEQVFKPRRTMTLLLGFIEAVTFYHQYQRAVKKDSSGRLYIETTMEDISVAFDLLKDVLFSKSDELTKAARDFLERLKVWLQEAGKESFTAKEIRKLLRLPPATLKRYLSELERYGYIKSAGNRYIKYEYSITDYEEYSSLKSSIDSHLQNILVSIRNVKQWPSGSLVAH